MNEFIRRANLALFTRRLADPVLTEAQRKVLVSLWTEHRVKAWQKHRFDPCQSAAGEGSLLPVDHSQVS
jgi:hypothetical protein